VDDRDPGSHGGIVEGVARLERVGPVQDDVIALDQALDVVRGEHLLVGDDADVGVESGDRLPGAFRLLLADAVIGVEDLALEVRHVDDVEIDDSDRADAGRRQVEAGRRAQPARADEQDLRVEELRLALGPDLRDEEVAAVALLLVVGQDRRHRPRQPGRLPALESARHRAHVPVAERAQELARKERADAARAVDDHGLVVVRDGALDALLEPAPREVDGARDMALLPLARLADVDDRRGVVLAQGLGLARAHFGDLAPGLPQEVGV
jgi:hypothetical protein